MAHHHRSGEKIVKCVVCLIRVVDAHDAVTVVDGHALCLAHLSVWSSYRQQNHYGTELRLFIGYLEQLSER